MDRQTDRRTKPFKESRERERKRKRESEKEKLFALKNENEKYNRLLEGYKEEKDQKS